MTDEFTDLLIETIILAKRDGESRAVKSQAIKMLDFIKKFELVKNTAWIEGSKRKLEEQLK